MVHIEIHNRDSFNPLVTIHVHGISGADGYVVEEAESVRIWPAFLPLDQSPGPGVMARRAYRRKCVASRASHDHIDPSAHCAGPV